MALIANFLSLVRGEVAENIRKPKGIPEIEINHWTEGWRAHSINNNAVTMDTAVIAAATIIREQYQPPVLDKTIPSLKPLAIELMGRIDAWLSQGIAVALRDGNPHPNINIVPDYELRWHHESGLIIQQLKRIYAACGGKMTAGIDPSSRTFSVAMLRTLTGLRNTTLNKYTKLAGVPVATRGKRNHAFSQGDLIKILNSIISGSGEESTIQKCKRALADLAANRI